MLKCKISLESGITLEEAVVFIRSISFDFMTPNTCTIKVLIYVSLETYNKGLPEIISLDHKCINEFQQFFSTAKIAEEDITVLGQAELYLKTLPLYQNAQTI